MIFSREKLALSAAEGGAKLDTDFALIQANLSPFASIGTHLPTSILAAPV
jgi:hypothetical protein